jgi:lantibiotic modifying enzyme
VDASVQQHRPSPVAPRRTLGLAFGMTGIAYAALTATRLLPRTNWLRLARDAAEFVTQGVIDADETLDVMDGSAGALLVFLSLWEHTADEEWLNRAILCGNHLLRAHRAHPWWTRSVKTINVGMAHGVAGVGFALCRLSRATGIDEFLELGLAALTLADSAYEKSRRDWSAELPVASIESANYWNRWCHGAVGVGIAWREQARENPRATASVVTRATEAVLENPTRPADSLCCGNFGNLDFLSELAAEKGSDPLRVARTRAACLIGARSRTGYACDGPANEASLGLFPGLAGIGYVLVRLIAPNRVPSLLAFS